ncbi:methyltransferase [Lentzea sp.]|uniref:methyltransferase n=1 Tax=Lentzea sp. TaxID=56099 RepID=UPI002C01DAFB|nr:methyltransferase [Lentzea sp.]HUQ56319.1 methyltransferase [Lentzea sp.]
MAEIATEQIAERGLTDRIAVQSDDLLTEDLPAGHDAILLSGVLHDWDPQTGRTMLRKSEEAWS